MTSKSHKKKIITKPLSWKFCKTQPLFSSMFLEYKPTNFDFNVAMKLWRYADLVGIDNSSLDRSLKDSETACCSTRYIRINSRVLQTRTTGLRLHVTMLSCREYYVNSFLLLYKNIQTYLLSFVRMLRERTVVFDCETFPVSKQNFIVKELATCRKKIKDCVLLLPPSSFNSLPTSAHWAFNWLTNNLHCLHWNMLSTRILIWSK